MRKILKPLTTVRSKSTIPILSVVMVTLFSMWVTFESTKAEVVVAADGDVQVVKTHVKTVGELLNDLGIDVEKYDELSHEEDTEIENGMEIYFKKAKRIYLTVDGEKEEYYTTAETVGEFFKEKDLSFSKHDEISHNRIAVLENDLEIEVKTAFPIVVNDGGNEVEIWTTGGTVEQFLDEHKDELTYDEADEIKVEPGLDEKITEDTEELTIIHVEKQKKEVEETIPFHEEKRNDSSLYKGETRTISDGEEGIVEKVYEITLENGKEVNRKVIEENVVKESKNKVVAVGTKEKPKSEPTKSSSSSNSNGTSESGKVLTMVATAYSPNCSGCSGYSATGINLKQKPTPKVISVDPNVIPLGTRVWVEGYGEAIAADTGGAIKGNRIDVLVGSEAYAKNNWGRKTVKVKILD